MGRRAVRNVRVLQAALAHYLRRGWLLPTMYLPPGATRGCAGAASRSMGSWGCPMHPLQPLQDGAQLGLH